MTPGDDPHAMADRRRVAIVEAAYALVERDGLDAVTIRAVLAASGLSRRAFYERFEGKDDLMLALFEHTIRLGTEQFRGLLAAAPIPLEGLRIIVTGIVLGRSHIAPGSDAGAGQRLGAAMSREHLRLAESRPEQLQAALAPLLELIAEPLMAGMADGTIRAGAADRIATLIYNLVSTTIHKELIRNDLSEIAVASRTQLAAELWRFCRRAVAT